MIRQIDGADPHSWEIIFPLSIMTAPPCGLSQFINFHFTSHNVLHTEYCKMCYPEWNSSSHWKQHKSFSHCFSTASLSSASHLAQEGRDGHRPATADKARYSRNFMDNSSTSQGKPQHKMAKLLPPHVSADTRIAVALRAFYWANLITRYA